MSPKSSVQTVVMTILHPVSFAHKPKSHVYGFLHTTLITLESSLDVVGVIWRLETASYLDFVTLKPSKIFKNLQKTQLFGQKGGKGGLFF